MADPVFKVVESLTGGSSGGGGVTDHGGLTGLADDDHPQYLNVARGDARYYTELEVDALIPAAVNSGISSAIKAGTSTITIPYPGSDYYSGTISAPGVVAGMRVFLSLAVHTGDDENSEEMLSLISLSGSPGLNTITVSAVFERLERGAIKINYLAL